MKCTNKNENQVKDIKKAESRLESVTKKVKKWYRVYALFFLRVSSLLATDLALFLHLLVFLYILSSSDQYPLPYVPPLAVLSFEICLDVFILCLAFNIPFFKIAILLLLTEEEYAFYQRRFNIKRFLLFLGVLLLILVVALLTIELDYRDQVIRAKEAIKSYEQRCQDPNDETTFSEEVSFELWKEELTQSTNRPASIFQKIRRVLLYTFKEEG